MLRLEFSLLGFAEIVVNEVTNAQPITEGFWFKKLENVLGKVGQYRLEYKLLPALPGKEPLTINTHIHVSAGPAKSFVIKVTSLCKAWPSSHMDSHLWSCRGAQTAECCG